MKQPLKAISPGTLRVIGLCALQTVFITAAGNGSAAFTAAPVCETVSGRLGPASAQ
jgi:hypothetical protein